MAKSSTNLRGFGLVHNVKVFSQITWDETRGFDEISPRWMVLKFFFLFLLSRWQGVPKPCSPLSKEADLCTLAPFFMSCWPRFAMIFCLPLFLLPLVIFMFYFYFKTSKSCYFIVSPLCDPLTFLVITNHKSFKRNINFATKIRLKGCFWCFCF